MLAPFSTLLADLFQQLTCPHQPQPITVVLDLDPDLVVAFLSLIYTGSTTLPRSRMTELKEMFKMLGFQLPGGLNQAQEMLPTYKDGIATLVRPKSTSTVDTAVQEAPLEAAPLVSQPPNPSNLSREPQASSGPRGRMVRKRGGGLSRPRSRSNSGHGPPEKRSRMELRLDAHLALANTLKDALPGAVARCTMPGCGEKLSQADLASHFLAHQREETLDRTSGIGIVGLQRKSPAVSPVRKQPNQDVLEKLRKVLGDSSSDEDEENCVVESPALVPTARISTSPLSTLTQENLPSTGKESLVAMQAEDNQVDAKNKAQCTLCAPTVTFKTEKARTVHVKTMHGYGASRPRVPKLSSAREKKHGCQICTKTYTEFAKLRTHYTLYHFWERLENDYSGQGDACHICSVKFPTHDHLLQHLGNFHCLIDPYLQKKGLRLVSFEKTIRLKSWRCEICQMVHPTAKALKVHLSVKHFYKELKAEFPTASARERKCPKCYKTYEGSTVAFVIGHIGSIHDEVLKYAANYLDIDAADRSLLPVDDFDDDTVGVPFEKEKTSASAGGPGRGPFECQVCQICLHQEPNPRDLKNHYLGHYREQVMSKVASNGLAQCPFCTNILHNMAEAVTHVTSAHLSKVLFYLLG